MSNKKDIELLQEKYVNIHEASFDPNAAPSIQDLAAIVSAFAAVFGANKVIEFLRQKGKNQEAEKLKALAANSYSEPAGPSTQNIDKVPAFTRKGIDVNKPPGTP